MSAEPRKVGPSGFVSIVGAGPGDPALLTRRAVARLRHADLVLYDALVGPAVLKLARRGRRFYVGKRCGRPSMTQEAIHRLMIRAARRGQRVVRLKGGDPFVLGRGGEEALALRAANVRFDVVPGVSSAIAAPALAGIPVTHRGVSSAFLVLSAHTESSFLPVVEALAPQSITLVALMGLAARGRFSGALIARGWSPGTPAAVVRAAGTPGMTVWTGRLDELAAAPDDTSGDAPGTIVIGDVVRVRDQIAAGLGGSPATKGVAAPEWPWEAAARRRG
jgi:uroporphyrin-III C-methyltransferase/precorrin-2 dehydrogenase/sirohydrochlorin ferrochelatase